MSFCSELPQALFQLGLLALNKNENAPTSLILLSVGISSLSLMLQVLQLRSLAQKESFDSVFDLIQALARGSYVAGVNQIKKSSSSILNVTSTIHRFNKKIVHYKNRNLNLITALF